MRNAYVVQYRGGMVALSHPVMEQIAIEEASILYALTLPREHSCVLSPIPIDRWPFAHRLVVYTTGGAGRLAAVTRVLAEMEINVLSASAAAISPDAQLCITAIVEAGESACEDFVTNLTERLRDTKLKGRPVLLGSGLFSPGGLGSIKLTPLSVLHALFRLIGDRPRYELHVSNWMIDLRVESIAKDGGKLLKGLEPEGTRAPGRYALITPDTEERYLTLSLVDPRAILRRVSFPIEVESPDRLFAGYFQAAIEALASQKFNLYSAKDLLLRKTRSNGPDAAEAKRFSFLADVSESHLAGATNPNPSALRKNLCRPFRDAIEGHRLRTDEKTSVRIDLEADLEVGTLRELLPLCFFATNVEVENREHLGWARRIFAVLLHLGFRPVQVDIALSDSLLDEARALIDTCPVLVSFHLPNERNLLSTGQYTPSDWVLFEEACMLEQGRRIFPVSHVSIRQPNYRRQIREWRFESERDLDRICLSLRDAISAHMKTRRWRRELAETARRIREKEPVWVERTMTVFWNSTDRESRGDLA